MSTFRYQICYRVIGVSGRDIRLLLVLLFQLRGFLRLVVGMDPVIHVFVGHASRPRGFGFFQGALNRVRQVRYQRRLALHRIAQDAGSDRCGFARVSFFTCALCMPSFMSPPYPIRFS